MHAELNVALTRDDYAGGLGALTKELGRRDPFRDKRIWEQLGTVSVLFAILIFTFRDSGLAILVTLMAQAFLIALLGERWARRSFGVSYDPATASFTVKFSEEGIDEQNPTRERHWKWAAVRQIHDTGTALTFELDGWDMLILPDRLWPDAEAKAAFLRQARSMVPPRASTQADSSGFARVESPAREQLQLGAIAAGADLLFAITFLLPAGRGGSVPVMVVGLLIGAGAGYLAYRLARYALPELHAAHPRAAIILSHALTWAVPLYIAVGYFGWV